MRDSRVNLANNVPNEGERLNNEGKSFFRNKKYKMAVQCYQKAMTNPNP